MPVPTKKTEDQVVENAVAVLSEQEVQLSVHMPPYVVPVSGKAGKVVVENLGGGDLYVGDEDGVSFKGEHLVVPGEKKEFEDVSAILLMSASRPSAKVTLFRK